MRIRKGFCLIFVFLLFKFFPVCYADFPGAIRSGQERDLLSSGTQELIQLRKDDATIYYRDNGYAWIEAAINPVDTHSQGYVDAITGQDGYLYCAYFDDRHFPDNPNHKSVFVQKSVDGGETWQNIDHGASGFALAFLGGPGDARARPSVEVFRTSPGNYRVAVAVCAGNPGLTRYSTIVMWKDIGTGSDWNLVYISNPDFDFVLHRIKAIPRPGQPDLNRLVVGYVNLDYGFYISKYSDTNAVSFMPGEYISDIPANWLWRPDFVYDPVNNWLFSIWSMSTQDDPNDLPRVFVALSPNRGQTWFYELYAVSPAGWNACAEAVAAISKNPAIEDRTLMMTYSARQHATNPYRIEFSYQYINSMTATGTGWNIAPPGSPMRRGTVYSDTDFDNTIPSIVSDNRSEGGGYRIALLDQTGPETARILFTETPFDTPFVWSEPEQVSSEHADPARQGPQTGVSTGLALGTDAYQNVRNVFWPDFRNGAQSNIYASHMYREPPEPGTPTVNPTMTPTPEPTVTPTLPPTNTPNPTNTPIPTNTSVPTHTPTNTPHPTNSPSPTTTPTETIPTNTPAPQPTQTPSPTPENTPTPQPPTPTSPPSTHTPEPDECNWLGTQLEISQKNLFRAGDIFSLKCHVCMDTDLANIPTAALLAVHGAFWYWPEWSMDFSYNMMDFESGLTSFYLLEPFVWPEVDGIVTGLVFYSALLNPEITGIIGEFDQITFGYTDH